MTRILLVVLLAFYLVGCAEAGVVQEDTVQAQWAVVNEGYAMEVMRFIDEEAGVACWVAIGYNRGGISCVPLDQLKDFPHE